MPADQNPQNKSTVGKYVGPLAIASAGLLGAMHLWEKQVLEVYPDKLARGLPTFCSGSTDWNAPIGKKFTKEQCDVIDAATAEKYNRGVLGCAKVQYLTQEVFDSMTLFAINVGIDGACKSRAMRLLNMGAPEAACKALAFGPDGQRVWVYADGKFVKGLANRRDFESNWCLRSTGVI